MYTIIRSSREDLTNYEEWNNAKEESINLNTLKKQNLVLGNVNKYGIEVNIMPNNVDINYYKAKAYPTGTFYDTISLTYNFKYKLTYKFNPYKYITNGFIGASKGMNDNEPWVPRAFCNGFKQNIDNVGYILNGFKITFNNDINYNSNNTTDNRHVINAAGGSYYNDPTLENYLTNNTDLNGYNPIYAILNKKGVVYNWSWENPNELYKLATPVYDTSINELSNFYVNYKQEVLNFYVGWYKGEMTQQDEIPLKRNYDTYPSLANFYGFNINDYQELYQGNKYKPKILAQYNNKLFVSDTFYPMTKTSGGYYENPIQTITKSLGTELIRSGGYINNEWLKQSLFTNYLIELTKNYTFTHISGNQNYQNTNNGVDNWNYSLATKEKLTEYAKPLNADFEVENTLYFNNLNQLNLTASGFNLSKIGIMQTEAPTIRDGFNAAMNIGLGATATITTIVSAIFLFRGLIALFRSNK